MILKSIKYNQSLNDKIDWAIKGKDNTPVTFSSNVNLIVAKNASGKSKTLEALRHISDLISGEKKLPRLYNSFEYELIFEDGSNEITYNLNIKNNKITYEVLRIDKNEPLLERTKDNSHIFFNELEKSLDFKIPNNELAAFLKRDEIQHPYLENLYKWSKKLSHYRFGSPLGKDHLARKGITESVDLESTDISFKTTHEVIQIFVLGKVKFGDEYTNAIIKDMQTIGYDLEMIGLSPLRGMRDKSDEIVGLMVKEKGLDDLTDQHEMSQGMFRAYSLLILLNYSLFEGSSNLILIDDIGEGLDYERSKRLIEIIIEKALKSPIQVIMTTNNRFVMNKISLEYWSVILRNKNTAIFYNYRNSKKTFDDFVYTGLNNFDFLETEFYSKGFEEFTK